ncbi:cytidylate kinase-like family protein [Coraliomargarita sp. SDUM461004]|uniref:Cytidylate kinase-like family protein n=1 Tax=Thalassobacterium sedimentorum TaxID=3041258 RepID=A0ABU1ADW9_9BACT|nr:cytidylate kinase-like family protein [Coraliomargarita sp. SDUM461004]MDQ8192838.1 cytidylate kinase-like family protein [Coraliomargarita sp. SDUM461004]
MNTIAISRLLGSDAGRIAQKVADSLGYDLVDKSILQGTLQQYGLTRFGELYTSPPNLWDLANSKNLEMVSMLNETMQALAYRGRTVILARGGYVALNKYADVLNVRLHAPTDVRVERVMARERITDRSKAACQVAADDKARIKFVERFYGCKWHDESDFDLVMNTDLIPATTAEAWIIDAIAMLEAKTVPANALLAKNTKVDPLLLSAIEEALELRV